MHCQSQISIIWNNGVERAHKVKMQIKHIQIRYMNREDIREREVRALIPEEALMQTGQSRMPGFSAASLEPSSGCRAQTCSHCPPDPGWFSTAV